MVAPTEPDLVARRVVDTGWSLYAVSSYVDARGRPSSYDDLTGHDVILFEASLARSPGAQWLSEGRGGRPALRANSVTGALNAAIPGFGVAAAPCLLGDAEPTLTRLTPELIATCTAYLVTHRDLARVTRVRTVADFVVDLLKADAQALMGSETRAV
jgi:DNA-binding transcriptional LysR family regulator